MSVLDEILEECLITLHNVSFDLDDKSKKVIFESIKEKLYDLMSCGIYPLDLKEENILINKDSLDVQFIDLDGDETKYDGVFRNYVNMFDTLKGEVIKGFELMDERLRTKWLIVLSFFVNFIVDIGRIMYNK